MESKGMDKRQKFDDNQQISTWDDNHSVKEVDRDKAVSTAETNDDSHDVDFSELADNRTGSHCSCDQMSDSDSDDSSSPPSPVVIFCRKMI